MKKILAIALLACVFGSCKKEVSSDINSKTEEDYKNLLIEKFYFKIGQKASPERLQDKSILHFSTFKEAYEYYSRVEGTFTFTNKVKKSTSINKQLRTTGFGTDYQSYYDYLNLTDHLNGSLSGTLAISVEVTPDVGYSWTRDDEYSPKQYNSYQLRTMNFGDAEYGWSGVGYIDGGIGGASYSQSHFQQFVQHYATIYGYETSSLIDANLNCSISVPGSFPVEEIPSWIYVTSTFTARWVE